MKRKFHEMSSMTSLERFNLWTVSPTQVVVDHDFYTDHRPLAVVQKDGPIDFALTTAEDEFICFSETKLFVKLKLTLAKNDATAITENDWSKIVPANNLLHSLFKRIELKINDVEVTRAPSVYAYRAYFDTLLSFTKQAKKGYLQCVGWADDRDVRTGFLKKAGDKASFTLDLVGKIHTDLTFQQKALIGKSTLALTLHPNPSSFFLEVPDGYTVTAEIVDPTLRVKRSRVTDILLAAVRKAIAISPAKYEITRSEVNYLILDKGITDRVLDNVYHGQLPRRLFLAMVETDAVSGNLKKNPYYFDHNYVSWLVCYIDGQQYPRHPFQPDFENGHYVQEFEALYDAIDQNGTDAIVNINREEFAEGNTIFAFNFAPDLSNGPGANGHVNLVRRGELRIHIRFAKPLKTTTTLLLYTEYDNMIEIDQIGNVSMSVM